MKKTTKSDKNEQTKYKLAAEKFALGFSPASIAKDLNIHRSTIYEWMKEKEFNNLVEKYRKAKLKNKKGPLDDLYKLEKERSQQVYKQYTLVKKHLESSISELSARMEELNKGKFKGCAEEAGAIRIAYQFSEGKISTWRFVFENILGGTPSQYMEAARKEQEREQIQNQLNELQKQYKAKIQGEKFDIIEFSLDFLQSAISLFHDKEAIERLTSIWNILSKTLTEHERLKYHKSQLVTINQFNQLLRIIEEIVQKQLGDDPDKYEKFVEQFKLRMKEAFPQFEEAANEEDGDSPGKTVDES